MLRAPIALGLAVAASIVTAHAAAPRDDGTSTSDTVSTRVPAPFDSVDRVRLSAAEFVVGGDPYATISGRRPLRETSVDPVTGAIIGGLYGGMFASLHYIQQNAWWRERVEFHVTEEWVVHSQIDKLGHLFGGYLQSYLFTHALVESGVDWDASVVAGSIMALLSQTYVEVQDGYSRNWGFSPSDEASNLIGAGLFVAQHYLPALASVVPRWQYVPTTWTGSDTRLGATFIDDYSSTTFWYGLKVHDLLPDGARELWPRWLMLSVGYGVYDAELLGLSYPPRRYMIALDYDLVELLPSGAPLWNWVRQTLNFIKLPSPTLEIGRETRFRLLFPFQLSLGNLRF